MSRRCGVRHKAKCAHIFFLDNLALTLYRFPSTETILAASGLRIRPYVSPEEALDDDLGEAPRAWVHGSAMVPHMPTVWQTGWLGHPALRRAVWTRWDR
eukprot:584329-Prorocentrum_minimum.AAC.1